MATPGKRRYDRLLPQEALAIPLTTVLSDLREQFRGLFDEALAPESVDPKAAAWRPPGKPDYPASLDTSWILRSNLVGINIRTVESFAGVLKYSLTLPAAQNAIHLLPFWEPGVVGSLYGMSSWKIAEEFFSDEWVRLLPYLDTPAKQLKALVNLLHATGRQVGMDVIPHTDRFSEIVLANPGHFEWLRRRDKRIVDHRAELHVEVEKIVRRFLREEGPAIPGSGGNPEPAAAPGDIFAPGFDETTKNRLLFGDPGDAAGRIHRRSHLAQAVYRRGYEPVPATMGPPYRGLEVDPGTEYRDAEGHVWRDFRITEPEPMSRVFGPLTRYKLYERLQDNSGWKIDFDRPRKQVWDYVCEHYGEIQRCYGFDFMRGDMSHVQMRPTGVPPKAGEYYDLLGSVKRHIGEANAAPGFAYFAETFLAPPGVMAYGNEIDHLEAASADATLGDLQSVSMGSNGFIQRLRWYSDIAATRRVVPAFTVMTGDKDDPRFDEFYFDGNEARYFMALFLVGIPSYMALNFEVRDPHPKPAPNEHYTKLYVFQECQGPKATRGPFRFGGNATLYRSLRRIREFHEGLCAGAPGPTKPELGVRWLLPPDATAGQRYMAWTLDQAEPQWLFLVNSGTKGPSGAFRVPLFGGPGDGAEMAPGAGTGRPLAAKQVFSTYGEDSNIAGGVTVINENMVSYLHVENLGPGEGRVYRLEW